MIDPRSGSQGRLRARSPRRPTVDIDSLRTIRSGRFLGPSHRPVTVVAHEVHNRPIAKRAPSLCVDSVVTVDTGKNNMSVLLFC